MNTNLQNTGSTPGLRVQSSNHQETAAELKPQRSRSNREWHGVFFNGPHSDRNRDGDEVPVWCVFVGDGEAEPVGKVYWPRNYKAAGNLARRMAHDRRLEFINEASPA